MVTTHNRSTSVSEFVLICFPGLEGSQHWLSIPMCCLFLVVLAANTTLIVTIYSSPSLHRPLYYLLCLLALVDLLISSASLPKALAVLWFNENTISPLACFSQVFLLFSCSGLEAYIFTCLAFDRYVAICIPLHHSLIITSRRTAQVVAGFLIANTVAFLPYPLLAARLHYCAGNAIPHCVCETLPLTKLACDSNIASNVYGVVVSSVYICFLSFSLAFSYGMILRAVLRKGSWGAARKAFSTCSSHLILVSYNSFTLIFIHVSNRMEGIIPRYGHVLLRFSEFLVNPALNPLVYGIRNKEIWQEIVKLVRKITHVFTQ